MMCGYRYRRYRVICTHLYIHTQATTKFHRVVIWAQGSFSPPSLAPGNYSFGVGWRSDASSLHHRLLSRPKYSNCAEPKLPAFIPFIWSRDAFVILENEAGKLGWRETLLIVGYDYARRTVLMPSTVVFIYTRLVMVLLVSVERYFRYFFMINRAGRGRVKMQV